MRNSSLCLYLGGVASGIALIVACGDNLVTLDARASDAATAGCSNCEKPITRDRVYYVRSRDAELNGERVYVSAQCNPGDLILGGGCWIYSPNATQFDGNYAYVHPLIAQGLVPAPPMGTSPDE